MERKQAVALEYNKEQQDGAPCIVAVGEGFIAEKIIETALEYGVPLVENKELIGKLVRFPLGAEIPPELYQAVAQVLAFVYRLEQEKRESRTGNRKNA